MQSSGFTNPAYPEDVDDCEPIAEFYQASICS